MPPTNVGRRTRLSDHAVQQSLERAASSQDVAVEGPWKGLQTDIRADVVGLNGADNVKGLQPVGDALVPHDGFARVDPDSLPLGEDSGAASAPAVSGEEQPIACLGLRYSLSGSGSITQQVFAFSQKTSATVESRLWVIVAGTWTVQAYNKGSRAGADDPPVSESGIYDSDVFPLGTPASKTTNGTVDSNASTGAGSVLVWTNNEDHVWKYPRDNGAASQYSHLTIDAEFDPFKARSCESFSNRMNFLNTEEAGTRHHQRFRWTQIGTADPTEASGTADPGGKIDLYTFRREGLRVESLGRNILALYFADGVCFARPTADFGILTTNPYSYEIITTFRGPLSTFSVTPISRDRHFIIANDGWWILDSGANWFEAGLLSVGVDTVQLKRGQALHKWKQSFYSQLNRDALSVINATYDPFRNQVLISWPSTGSDTANRIWYYDIDTDSVWPDDWGSIGGTNVNSSYLSGVNLSEAAGTTWGAASGTWAAGTGPWSSYAPRFGDVVPWHGTAGGLVFFHDPTVVTKDGEQPLWLWESHEHSFGDPKRNKTLARMWVEHIKKGDGLQATIEALADAGGRMRAATVSLSGGTSGKPHSVFGDLRLTDRHLAYRISGQGDVELLRFILEMHLSNVATS